MNALVKLPELPQQVEIAPSWIEARNEIVAVAAGVTEIADATAFDAASELLRKITKTSNALEKFRKEISEPFNEAQRLVKRAADAAREPLEAAKAKLQNLLSRYAAEQQRRVDEERARIEAEQRAAVEKQIAKRAAAEAAAAELGIEELPPPPEPLAPAIATTEMLARANAVRVQEVIDWTILDEGAIPAVYKMVDDRRVNGWLAQNRDMVRCVLKEEPERATTLIPGIVFEIKTKVISR